jgi:hypothetical protein
MRTKGGTFAPGFSGNPQGRPMSHNAAIREQLAEGKEEVVIAILEAAIGGDMQAAKLVLDRLLPPLKPVSQAVALDLPATSSPLEIGRAILAAAASGSVPSDIAGQLVTALVTLCKIEEVEDLRERIAALEKATRPPITTKTK